MNFGTTSNHPLIIEVDGTSRWSFDTSGGMISVGVTGGDKGAGTLNAAGLYVNGVAVAASTGANPTGTVGLTAVNGTATTFLRSDGAPALSQAIAPTWTAAHVFTATGTTTSITVNQISTMTQGILVAGGTSTSTQITVSSVAGASAVLALLGDGLTAAAANYIRTTPSGNLAMGTNNGDKHTITAAGLHTFAVPSSGNETLLVNCLDNSNAMILSGSTTGVGYNVAWQDTTATRGWIGFGSAGFNVTGSAITDFGVMSVAALKFGVSSTRLVMSMDTNGQVSIPTPNAGVSLTVAASVSGSAIQTANIQCNAAAATASSGSISYGGTVSGSASTTVGGVALPALAVGFIIVNVAGTARKIPYFAT